MPNLGSFLTFGISILDSKFAVSVNLDEWAVLFPQQMGREVEQFVGMLQQCAQGVNFRLAHPKMQVYRLMCRIFFFAAK